MTATAAAVLGLLGMVAAVCGLILTLTIVGAIFGVPLLAGGACLVIIAINLWRNRA